MGTAICEDRYRGDSLKNLLVCLGFFFFFCWFSLCSNLISNIITFNLIIDLNESHFYLSRSLAGLKEAARQLSERGKL